MTSITIASGLYVEVSGKDAGGGIGSGLDRAGEGAGEEVGRK
jgi:hypothetical protein